MPRLFTAIAIPEQVDRYLDNVILNSEPLYIQPEKHITLQFIGHVTTSTAKLIESELTRLRGDEFKLSAEGCELFKPNSSRPILVALVKPDPALTDLCQRIGHIITERGIPLDTRPYKPHITLVRFLSPSPVDIEKIQRRANAIHTEFVAGSFVLYGVDRALETPYFKLREYPLVSAVS